jgi:hypothetical protein
LVQVLTEVEQEDGALNMVTVHQQQRHCQSSDVRARVKDLQVNGMHQWDMLDHDGISYCIDGTQPLTWRSLGIENVSANLSQALANADGVSEAALVYTC